MPRMTKAQARKRILEAGSKMDKVAFEGAKYLTAGQRAKLIKMSDECIKMNNQILGSTR